MHYNYNVVFREKILVIGSKSQHSSFVVQIRGQRRGCRYIFHWFKVLGIYSNGCGHWLREGQTGRYVVTGLRFTDIYSSVG